MLSCPLTLQTHTSKQTNAHIFTKIEQPTGTPDKTTNLSGFTQHPMAIHPGIMLQKQDQRGKLSYLYQVGDSNNSLVTISPHKRSISCFNSDQSRTFCTCPFGGDPVQDGDGCESCWEGFRLESRSNSRLCDIPLEFPLVAAMRTVILWEERPPRPGLSMRTNPQLP